MKKIIAIIILLLLSAYIATIVHWRSQNKYLKWNWDKINTEVMAFPDDFLWGTATAAHQVEGDATANNWTAWEEGSFADGRPHIHNNERSGKAADHWNRYPEDIKLMKELGLNAYRFSIAWDKIEPTPGSYDSLAIQHYNDLIDSLLTYEIEPMITLHHFVHPLWFEEKGAFEKEENLAHFVSFSERMFLEFSDRVTYWCTINEPNVFVAGGYFQENFPPGVNNIKLGAQVLKNLLDAHVMVYRKLKSLPNGNRSKIGLVKDIFIFEPRHHWDLRDHLIARVVDGTFNQSTLDYLKEGTYDFYFPPEVDTSYVNTDAKGALDFFGLNYYSHLIYNFSLDMEKALSPYFPPDEVMTDMEYTIYPEGLYSTISRASELGVPVIITENGLADAKDDRRDAYIRQHLFAVSKSIAEGHDVQGYFYWSLMDNFEWAEGYSMKFGLYEVDFETQKRSLREGAKAYSEIIAKSEGN